MVRIKERYLLVNIVYPEAAQGQAKANLPDLLVYNQPTANTCNGRLIQYAIKAQVTDLFGDYGAGAVERSLRVKYLSNATSTCIIQCSREHYRLVWAALTMMKHVPTKQGPGLPCIFRVVRVSGTIKKVEEEAIRRAKQLILAAKDEMAGKEPNALSSLFGAKDSANDVAMVDRENDSDSAADDSEEND
ncbi:RNA-binding protein pop5 [Diaporthe australafricana]|uniref:RNA-binding protein pop5 n=1 Tax=Diaporthe australafricana TaxID=127596 RepID=A0ABR3XUU5_9PEZI